MGFSSQYYFKGMFIELLSVSESHMSGQCSHLTYEEHERIAYIAGNGLLASALADASELESEVDLFDDILDRAKEESFESGKYEGIGIDTAEVIADLELQVKTLKVQHSAIRGDLESVQSWFESDASKTVAGRKKCVSEIRRRLLTLPRYQGSPV